MHKALIVACIKGVSTHCCYGRFGGHAGVANAMRARHFGKIELLCHIFGQAYFFVDLKAVAPAHQANIGIYLLQGVTHLLGRTGGNIKNGMGAFDCDGDFGAKRITECLFKTSERVIWICSLDSHLAATV